MENEQIGTLPCEVRTGAGQTDYKRALGYRCLGLRPRDVKSAPFFRANLTRIARLMSRARDKDEASGASLSPLDYLQYSDDPDAGRVLAAYRAVPPSYRRLLPPEAFCHSAGVSPTRILEIITTVAVSHTTQAANILAAIVHPGIVAKTIEDALHGSGKVRLAAQRMFHQATGWLPTWGWKDY